MNYSRVTLETARAEVQTTPRLVLCLKYGWSLTPPSEEHLLYDVWVEQWYEAYMAEQAEAAQQLELFEEKRT